MYGKSVIKFIYKVWIFMLPLLAIVTQWISIKGIRLSWILSLILCLFILLNVSTIMRQKYLLIVTFIIIFFPFITLAFSKAYTFNFTLYVSVSLGLMYMLYIMILTEEKYHIFVSGCLFACLFFGVLGAIEIFTGYYLFSTQEVFTKRLNEMNLHYPIVAFANVNDLAQYLVMLFPIASGEIRKKHKLLFGAMFLGILFVVYNTQSRLALIVLLVVFPLEYLLKTIISKKVKMWKSLACFFALIIFVLAVAEARGSLISRVLAKLGNINLDVDFIQLRLKLYIPLVERALKVPLGGFGTAYVINDMPPHNLFLFVLCDYGWIPTILLLLVMMKVFIKILYRARRQGRVMDYCILSLLCLSPIWSIISSCNEQRKVLWIFLGVCIYRAANYSVETNVDQLNTIHEERG